MADPKYAGWMPPRTGEPWETWEENKLWDDCKAGCDTFAMAMRLRRSEQEVEERLKLLGLVVRPRRIPGGRGWNR